MDASVTDQLDRLTSSLAGRYTFERELGRGGMATVYLAQDVKHGRRVAVKVLHAELAAALGRERFLREIEVAARLRHPHILPLHDSGEAEGALYYVMPYVEGESLQEKLRREQQVAIDEALTIAREVADALAYAHDRGVIHRDIKPANIMLESGHAVVTDFGVALLARAAASGRLTGPGLSPGTPTYMSPEQASAEEMVDGRTDIYSLGCILYEMLSGDPPFIGFSPLAVLARKLSEPVPGLRVVRATIPESLEQVTRKALARMPADRFRTAAEFAEALEAVALERVSARPGHTQPAWGQEDRGVGGLGGAPGTRESGPPGTPLSRLLGIGAAYVLVGALTLTAIGLLTTVVYDVKLQIPSQYTPSRLDFPLVGARALIPAVAIAFVALVVVVAAKHLARLVLLGLRQAPPLRRVLDRWRQRSSATWNGLWKTVDPAAAAELAFLAALVVSILLIRRFWPLLTSLWSGETAILSCSNRPLHHSYTIAMTVLITALALGWHRLFRQLQARQAGGARIALVRWGSLGWIGILLLMMTMPWRLLWNNEHPRALLNGERVYILVERGEDLVLYNADRGATEPYRRGERSDLQPLNTVGYVFEGREAAARGPGC